MHYALLKAIAHRRTGMDPKSVKRDAGDDSVVEKQHTASAPHTTTLDSSCSDAESDSNSNAAAGNRTPSGLILKSGRVRLPDKLMEYLNNNVAPEALFWMPEGESFAIDTEKAPEQVLNKYFGGSKVASFLRSISRWGFKRVFYHELGKHIYAFHHPLFKRDAPHLERDMKMIVSAPSGSKKAKKKSKMAKELTQNPSSEAPAPSAVSLSPVAPPQQLSLPSPVALVNTSASPAATPSSLAVPLLSNNTLSALVGQNLAGTSTQAPAPAQNQALLQGLLQVNQQQAAPPPNLGIASFLLQRPDEQLAQLLALQGAATNEGAGTPVDILRLAVARQLQQQQEQQQHAQQAVRDLLSALQNNNNQG